MTKNDILSQFINDKTESGYCLNPDILNVNYKQLSEMYDLTKEVVDSKTDWNDFLKLQNAITDDGRIREDRQSSYKDGKDYKDQKIVFKYYIYNWLKARIEAQETGVEIVNWTDLMKGNFNSLTDVKHIEAFARGLKKVKEKLGGVAPKVDEKLGQARKQYLKIKSGFYANN